MDTLYSVIGVTFIHDRMVDDSACCKNDLFYATKLFR